MRGKTFNVNRFIICSFLLLCFACGKEDKKTDPEPVLPVAVSSVSPDKGVEGQTVSITLANAENKILDYVKVGDHQLETTPGPFGNIINVTIPYMTEGGKYDVTVAYENLDPVIAKEAFEYLPFEFESSDASPVKVGTEMEFGVNINNPYIGLSGPFPDFSKLELYKEVNGQKVAADELEFSGFSSQENRILIKTSRNEHTKVPERYFIAYHENVFELENLKFVRTFKIWTHSYKTYPDDIIHIFSNLEHLTLNGFVNDVPLTKWTWSHLSTELPWYDNYYWIADLRVPVVVSAGEFTVTCTDPDGIELYPDSVNVISISDIYMCADENSFLPADEIKIHLEGGAINPYSCPTCPVKVILRNTISELTFECEIKTEYYREYVEPNTSYVTVTAPPDIPRNAFYHIEVTTEHGYIYKPKDGCNEGVIFIE